jgi:hypothetical protein
VLPDVPVARVVRGPAVGLRWRRVGVLPLSVRVPDAGIVGDGYRLACMAAALVQVIWSPLVSCPRGRGGDEVLAASLL